MFFSDNLSRNSCICRSYIHFVIVILFPLSDLPFNCFKREQRKCLVWKTSDSFTDQGKGIVTINQIGQISNAIQYVVLQTNYFDFLLGMRKPKNSQQILRNYLPAIVVIVSSTKRKVGERQPYHRCIGSRINIPKAASFSIIYRKVLIKIMRAVGIVRAGEVVAILCKVATTHYKEQKRRNPDYTGYRRPTGKLALDWCNTILTKQKCLNIGNVIDFKGILYHS